MAVVSCLCASSSIGSVWLAGTTGEEGEGVLSPGADEVWIALLLYGGGAVNVKRLHGLTAA